MKTDFDIAIIGSGFAGSLLALICRRLGRSVVLVERGSHPRFAIGESSTPLANLLLEEIATRYDLPRLLPLTKWGTWQREHPELACGLKRGFTFLHHRFGEAWTRTPDRRNELLVAASPHDAIADTHWFRSDFDAFLVREAIAAGAKYLDRTALREVSLGGDLMTLNGERDGTPITINARLAVDATGPRGFLHRALDLGEVAFPALPATQSLFSHFQGVQRLSEMLPPSQGESPPYPLDDAAVHHVFEGGWIWVLQFNNGIASAGAALTPALAREIDAEAGPPAWQRLLDRLPTVKRQFQNAHELTPFRYEPRLPFCSRRIAGKRWALLPFAAGFVDPMLSTGFPLALLGVQRIGGIVERFWNMGASESALREYASRTSAELDAAACLVAALYANLDDFPLFVDLTRIYFAAASFAETARRLEREGRGSSFLLHDVAAFWPRCRALAQRATQPLDDASKQELRVEIEAAIAAFDIAGLRDRSRRNWHAAEATDLYAAAHLLGASRAEIDVMLQRAGFFAASPAHAGTLPSTEPNGHALEHGAQHFADVRPV